MEVGPLARLLVAYAAGQPDVKALVAQDIGEAFRTLEQCQRSIGTASAANEEFRQTRTKLMAELEKLGSDGVPIVAAEEMRKMADKLHANDTRQALEILREAVAKVEEQKQLMMPDIGIDIDFLDEPKKGAGPRCGCTSATTATPVAREINIEIVGRRGGEGLHRHRPAAAGREKDHRSVDHGRNRPASRACRLMLSCKSVVSEELVGFESEFELTVD